MGLKVIGAGFGRTGTTSLKLALEKLGFGPCHHMSEVMPSFKQRKLWIRFTTGGDVSWDELFDGYQSCLDWPSVTYYKSLMQAYPQAKVILTTRDPESWYQSIDETIYEFMRIFRWWRKVFFFWNHGIGSFIENNIWRDTFHNRFEDKAYILRYVEQYQQDVIDTVPAERLLVYNVKQGWEPLCEFLNVPVPDEPFPYANDRKQMLRLVNTVRGFCIASSVLLIGGVAALVGYLATQLL